MVQKSVSDLIFDKFAESIKNRNDLFEGISDDFISLVRQKRPSKVNIEKLLRRKEDEDS